MSFSHELRGDERLIYFADSGLHAYNVSKPATADQFAQHMDDFADYGVDIYSQLIFAAGALKPGLFVPEHPDFAYWPNRKLQPLIDAGIQPLEVMVERAHQRGMKFFCKLRLTDWHRLRSPEESGFIARHPEFQNPDRKTRRTLDYRHREVWDYHAGLVEELVRRFDIDGITLNFTRGQAYFPKDVDVDKAALLTGFVRLIRQVVDDQTASRGRRLQLNAIVWPHLQQCVNYGVDVPTWIGKDLVDHVCPGNTAVSDPNMDHEVFSTLCRQSRCRYFPMLQPLLWQSEGLHAIGPEHVRALARGMYEGGADGISVFNWQFFWDIRGGRGPSGVTHGPWSDCRVVSTSEVDFPLALVPLGQARDPTELDREPRKYCFRPMNIREDHSYTLFEDAYRVTIPRTVGMRGAYGFKLPEDLSTIGGAYLVARILGLAPLEEIGGSMVIGPHDDTSGPEPPCRWPDEFEVDINGTVIPAESIQHVWHRSGRAKHLGRPLEPYTSIWFKLRAPLVLRGLNTLGITLRRLVPLEVKHIVIEEIDVSVLPTCRQDSQV